MLSVFKKIVSTGVLVLSNSSANSHSLFLRSTPLNLLPSVFYRVRAVLELRCKGCRIEKRLDRLFVECSIKPRHKQMQMISKEKRRRMLDADTERFPKNIVQLPAINKNEQRKEIRYQLRQAFGH